VHLLQVYSNPSPGAVTPQELVFRSTRSIRTDESRSRSRRARQLRADETGQLIARYLAVRNIRAVAEDFQVSRTTVARILAKHGVNTSRGMSEAQLAIAADLYSEGLSSATIGRRLGFDNHTILKGLRGLGVQVRPRHTRQ